MRDCLSDKEIRDGFGASDMWDRIDEGSNSASKPKQPSSKPKIIKPKD